MKKPLLIILIIFAVISLGIITEMVETQENQFIQLPIYKTTIEGNTKIAYTTVNMKGRGDVELAFCYEKTAEGKWQLIGLVDITKMGKAIAYITD